MRAATDPVLAAAAEIAASGRAVTADRLAGLLGLSETTVRRRIAERLELGCWPYNGGRGNPAANREAAKLLLAGASQSSVVRAMWSKGRPLSASTVHRIAVEVGLVRPPVGWVSVELTAETVLAAIKAAEPSRPSRKELAKATGLPGWRVAKALTWLRRRGLLPGRKKRADRAPSWETDPEIRRRYQAVRAAKIEKEKQNGLSR